MWPRTDGTVGPGADMTTTRRTKNAGLSGFVSFMKRKDAEAALREFDGFDWGGSVLRVGWSKAVPIAAKPLYGRCTRNVTVFNFKRPTVSSTSKLRDSRSPSRSRSRSRERHRSRSPRADRHHTSRRSRSRSWRPRSRRRRSSSRHLSYDESRSRSPRRRSRSPQRPDEDDVTDTFIRAVAAEVKGHDAKYEAALREREKDNPKYRFLLRRDVSGGCIILQLFVLTRSSTDVMRSTEVWLNPRDSLSLNLMTR